MDDKGLGVSGPITKGDLSSPLRPVSEKQAIRENRHGRGGQTHFGEPKGTTSFRVLTDMFKNQSRSHGLNGISSRVLSEENIGGKIRQVFETSFGSGR